MSKLLVYRSLNVYHGSDKLAAHWMILYSHYVVAQSTQITSPVIAEAIGLQEEGGVSNLARFDVAAERCFLNRTAFRASNWKSPTPRAESV